jgi:16S rRNA (cytosine967-C5)-methyltransferase
VDWQKPREIAARILLQHGEGNAFLEETLDRELRHHSLKAVDRSLIQELCYGVLRWRLTLDWLIDRQLHHRQPDPMGRTLLRLGLYQLFWLERVPPHAAVNETVDVVRALAPAAQAGFINAMLRTYARNMDPTRELLRELRLRDPAVGWSHPRWLVDRWKARLSPHELQAFLEWNNSPAPVYARINALRCEPGRLLETWRDEGVNYDFGRWDWVPPNLVFLLRRHPPLERLTSFRQGCFYIQDPSTLLPVSLLAPQPGARILDLCAAPGGKTTLLAQLIDNDGTIIAVDPDARRRQRLSENCERLGADVSVVPPAHPSVQGSFDSILVDAPCSNTGVLRRRLDARWRLRPAELGRCQQRQRQVLADGLRRLGRGGRLVYSTCSVEPEENEEVVAAALAEFPEIRRESERLLHPARDKVDGAFAALLRKA